MKIRKAIAYAYATSPHAVELGCGKTGCYYVTQSILREDGTWSPPYIAQGHDAFLDRNDPDLAALFAETEGDNCPYWNAHCTIEGADDNGPEFYEDPEERNV